MQELDAVELAKQAVVARIHTDLQKVRSAEVKELLRSLADWVFTVDFAEADVRRRLGTESPQLLRLFAGELGTNVNRYLVDLRLTAAEALLVQRSDLSVPEVARLVGYSRREALRSAFRRRFGSSPTTHAAKLRQQANRNRFRVRGVSLRFSEDPRSRLAVSERRRLATRLAKLITPKILRGKFEVSRRILQRELVFGDSALVEEMMKEVREQCRLDRDVGVLWAELASLAASGTRAVLGDRFAEDHALALAWQANSQRLAGNLTEAERIFEKAKKVLTEAIDTAEEINPRIEGLFWLIEGGLRSARRRFDDAEALLDRAALRGKSLGDVELEVDARLLRVAVAGYQGHFESMIPDLQIVASMKPALAPRSRLGVHQELSLLYIETGQLELAGSELPIAQALAEELDDTPCRHQLIWIEGMLARERGRLEEAEDLFRCARAGLLELGDHEGAAIVALDLAILCYKKGDSERVLDIVTDSVLPVMDALHLRTEAASAVKLLRDSTNTLNVPLPLLEQVRSVLLAEATRPN